MADTSPERQAYNSVLEQGYKGRFAVNASNIRLFKDNPYIRDLDESDRERLNEKLIKPYNGEIFYDDEKNLWVVNVIEDSNGSIQYEYTSRDQALLEKLKYYESKGVINQLMSAYNNGQTYKFYFNKSSRIFYPVSSLVFPEEYDHYSIREQVLNTNGGPIYVAGDVDSGSGAFVPYISMKGLKDTVTGTTYKRMNPGKLTAKNTANGWGEVENGKFYVVEFFNNLNEVMNTILFQAVEAATYDTQVPSASVVDLKIIVYREGVDIKSASNIYQIYAGEDLSKNVSYSIVAVYSDGTEKVITDKLDTDQLSREGWDVDTNGAPEGKKFEVTFTYYPQVDETGTPIGTGITRSVFFQVTAYTHTTLYKCLPVVWTDDNVDLTIGGNTATKTFKLKLYTLSNDGVLENRTRSFYNSMMIVHNAGTGSESVTNVSKTNLNAIYAYDPYNQCVSFTFVGNTVIDLPTCFEFSLYNGGELKKYRFRIAFNKIVNNSSIDVNNISTFTFVEAYNNDNASINDYGYANGDILSTLATEYAISGNNELFNKAKLIQNANGVKVFELSLKDTDTYIADRYSRIINGVKYKPNKVILYSVKDQTTTALNEGAHIALTATKVQAPIYNDYTVNELTRNLARFDYVLAQFRSSTETDDALLDIGVFSVEKTVIS